MSDFENEDGRIAEIDAPAGTREKSAEFGVGGHESVEAATVEMPSFPNASSLDEYGQAGHGDKLIKLRGKHPVGAWRDLPSVGIEGGGRWMARGGNVGFRMSDTDLVIDVDPRHFPEGEDVLTRFLRNFDLPPHPFVLTGGGGRHLYFRKPADLPIVHTLAAYPGFEFSTLGRYVVAAGSVHPDTGKLYRFDDDPLRLSLSEAPMGPDRLLDEIRKPIPEASSGEPGEITPEQLERLLSRLDVLAYNRRHDDWLRIMMAAHHGTSGEGVEEFVAWSCGDPDYADDEAVIRDKWSSLTVKPDGVKLRTLLKSLADDGHGAFIEEVLRSTAEEDFPDDLDAEPQKSRSVWNDWVFVADAMQFVRREDGKKWRTDQWKALYAGLYPDGDVLSAVWKGKLPIGKFESLVYLPETAEFPDGESGSRYNIWRKDGVEARPGDVTPFLVHMAYLFPDEKDRDHVLDYLALLVQRPADKIHFALLIRGAQGTGKSWIGRLMERIVGSRNTVRPSNEEVVSHWTAWMEGAQLAVIEELMTLGRKEVANRLKPAITDPTIRIEEKNCSLYSIPNCLNFVAFANHEDALPIEHGDRRWLVVFSPARPRDGAYYRGLFDFLDGDGSSYVKHWLLKRKVGLNPHGVAPFTAGKEAMRRLSIGDAEAYLLELFEERQPPFDFDLVRVDELVDAVPSALRGRSNLRARVSKFLKEEIGAVSHARYTKADRQRPAYQLWSIRNHDIWDSIGASGRIDAYLSHRSDDVLDQFKR